MTARTFRKRINQWADSRIPGVGPGARCRPRHGGGPGRVLADRHGEPLGSPEVVGVGTGVDPRSVGVGDASNFANTSPAASA